MRQLTYSNNYVSNQFMIGQHIINYQYDFPDNHTNFDCLIIVNYDEFILLIIWIDYDHLQNLEMHTHFMCLKIQRCQIDMI